MVKNTYYINQSVGNCVYLGGEVLINKKYHAKFKCKCGNHFIADIVTVARNSKKYCSDGCELKKLLPSNKKPTHGQSGTTEYRAWKSIKERCLNQKSDSYIDYGGRGISICKEWLDFSVFFKDMGYKPTKGHSLDRFPDVNGNYCKENCRWATSEQQNRNRRDNLKFTYNGEEKCLSELAKELNISKSTLRRWLLSGEKVSPDIKNGIKPKERHISYNGMTKSITQWAKHLNINRNTLYAKIRKGYDLGNVILEPIKKRKLKQS